MPKKMSGVISRFTYPDPSLDKTIGEKLRHLRNAHHVSQNNLACALGVSRDFIIAVENGYKSIDIRTLVAYTRAFNSDALTILAEIPDLASTASRATVSGKPSPDEVIKHLYAAIDIIAAI